MMNQGEHLQKGRCFSFIFERVCALVARIKFFLLVKWLALRAGQRQGGVFRLPPQKTLPSHTRWCKIILWVRFTLGNIFGFRAESRSEGTRDPLLFAPGARALTPDQQDGVGEKTLLLLQKNLFFQTLC